MLSSFGEHRPSASIARVANVKVGIMNSGIKFGLIFLGGIALGALGAVALSRGKLNLKPVAADLISRGMDAKDALMSKVEAVKEDMEDLAAEARQASEKRKAAKEAQETGQAQA